MKTSKPGPVLKKIELCRKRKEFYWVMKTEPTAYSIDDLKKDKKTLWDGIRNYQARNFMMNDMKIDQKILIYHSVISPPGIVGLASVSKAVVPDPEQFLPDSKYFDPKSSLENPRWHCIEVKFEKKSKRILTLDEIKEEPKLKNVLLIQKGQRLSIQPLSEEEFNILCQKAGL